MDFGVGTIKFKMSVGMEQLCRIVFSRTKKGGARVTEGEER